MLTDCVRTCNRLSLAAECCTCNSSDYLNKKLEKIFSSFSFMPYFPRDLKSLSPTNAVKICATNVQTWSTRNHLCNAVPTSLLSSSLHLTLRYCYVGHGQVLSLCVLLILQWFPVGKLAKVKNNSQGLSEFDCCYLVLRYGRFLKANFNVQFRRSTWVL